MERKNFRPNNIPNASFATNPAVVANPQQDAQPEAGPVPPLANAAALSNHPAARNLQEYSTIRTPQGPIDNWSLPGYQPIQPGEPYMEKLPDEAMNTKKTEILLKHARDNEELGDFKDAEKAYKKALKYTDKAEHYKLYAGCLKQIYLKLASVSSKDDVQERNYKEKAARAFYYLGDLYQKQGALEEAQAAYKASCELILYELPLKALVDLAREVGDTAEFVAALEKLADFYVEKGAIALAIEKLEEVFELVKSFKILEKLAVLYGQASGEDSQSKSNKTHIRRFELQINEDPKNIGLYRDYAWFLKSIGKHNEARAVKKCIDELLQAMQQKIITQKNRIQALEQQLEFLENRAIHLDFSHQPDMKDADLVPLLKKNSYTKLLNLKGCTNLTNLGLVALKGLRWLTSLNLWGWQQLTDEGLQHLASLTQLKTLDVCGCEGITDEGLQHLAGLIQLTSLNLCECERVSDAGLGYLAGLTQLKELNLGLCQITDEGLKHLAGLTQLTSLDLQGCDQITDEGLQHLAGLTQLTSLNLDDCDQITDEGLGYLSGLTQLSSLDLYNCEGLTNKAKKHLKKQIPGLKIHT